MRKEHGILYSPAMVKVIIKAMKARYSHHKLKNIHWLPLWWLMQLMSCSAYYLDRWACKLNMYLIDKLR